MTSLAAASQSQLGLESWRTLEEQRNNAREHKAEGLMLKHIIPLSQRTQAWTLVETQAGADDAGYRAPLRPVRKRTPSQSVHGLHLRTVE